MFFHGSREGETEGGDSRQVGRMFPLRRWEAVNSEPGGKICPGQKERCFCQGSRRQEERTGDSGDRPVVRRKPRELVP